MKLLNVIVKKRFQDRYTGVWHEADKRLTISDARYREIKRQGDYIEVEKSVKVEKAPEKAAEIKK